VVQNWTVTIETPVAARFPRSVIPAWILVAIGAVLVGVLAPHSTAITWIPVVLFGGIMVTFVIQLALDQKVGLVNRVTISVGGSVVILAIATGIFALIAA